MRLQKQPVYLDEEVGGSLPLSEASKGSSECSSHHIIPPPNRETILRLVAYAGVLSLGASLPLNFAPKV